ncbi:MAG: hypothetical protein EHM42_13570, partial [Planctomycetaceae bacterium]
LASDVATRAKLSEQDAQEFRDELGRRADKARQELNSEIDKRIDHAMIQMGIVKAGLKKMGNEAEEGVQSFVDQRLDEALARLKVARTEDIDSLTRRIELLEQKVAHKGV